MQTNKNLRLLKTGKLRDPKYSFCVGNVTMRSIQQGK